VTGRNKDGHSENHDKDNHCGRDKQEGGKSCSDRDGPKRKQSVAKRSAPEKPGEKRGSDPEREFQPQTDAEEMSAISGVLVKCLHDGLVLVEKSIRAVAYFVLVVQENRIDSSTFDEVWSKALVELANNVVEQRFTPGPHLQAYVIGIARCRAVDESRKAGRLREVSLELVEEISWERPKAGKESDNAIDFDDPDVREKMLEIMRDHIGDLTDAEQETILLEKDYLNNTGRYIPGKELASRINALHPGLKLTYRGALSRRQRAYERFRGICERKFCEKYGD
jgi:hypothetical protein